MELERRDVSSSESSSGSAEEDRMVRIELEAAEALADLAHLAMRESGAGVSAGKWGSKGKRAKKRVKGESPPSDPGLSPVVDPVPTCPDLTMDRAVVGPELDGEPVCGDVLINYSKVEVEVAAEGDIGLAKPSSSYAKNYPSCGTGRSRLNLTEAEKEERRLRRILANRESARQTIRRRQALCEELTRKAADLTWENGNLKREKELALKEYQSLEITNKRLKEQIAKVIKTEVEDSAVDLKPACVQMPATPVTNCPLFFYNQHTFSPVCWPSIIQASNAVHHGPPNGIGVPPNLAIPANGRLDPTQQLQENSMSVNGSRTPLYIMSCPWFFQAPEHGNAVHPCPSFLLKQTQDCSSVNWPGSGTSSSKCAAPLEKGFSPLSVKVKSETTGSQEVRVIHDLNETPVNLSPERSGQCTGPLPKEIMPLTPVTSAIAVKNEAGCHLEYASGANGFRTKASQLTSPFLDKNKDALKFSTKKLVDSAAAAEARRRRKELTKLKNLHGRQCRMNC